MKTTHALALCLSVGAGIAHAAPSLNLQSSPAAQPVGIDGVMDEAWSAAEPLRITVDELPYKPSNGYDGMQRTEVELRSLYDDQYVYFLLRYEDPTESLLRFPWVKQEDGSWQQMANKDSTGHENTWYEDKVALFWEIKEKGFKKKGCDMSCHTPKDGQLEGVKDSSAGRHYTKDKGETLDTWHWKSTRTGPVGQADDQFVDSGRQKYKQWGRHSDEGSGGYYANQNAEGKGPAWMNDAGVTRHRHLVTDATKVALQDSFQAGEMINGIVAHPIAGSRGDVSARGRWQDGYWTLEIRRKLVTQGPKVAEQDVQFSDLDKIYRFGVAVFDHSQINHLFHKKSVAFTFER